MVKSDNWKLKTLLIGSVVGIAAGLLGAYILVQRAEQKNTRPQLSAGEGVKVGLGVLGLMRLLAEFADSK